MMTDIEELKRKRFQFLNKIYEKSDGSEDMYLSMFDIGNELGFDKKTTENITEYLKGEYLLEYKALGGIIGITHYGIKEVEEALSNPSQPTEHFLPINIINIGHMENSQIQQGGINNTQNQTINQSTKTQVEGFIEILKEFLDKLNLTVQIKSELISDIHSVEAQLSSPKPKKTIIFESLKSIKNILETVGGHIAIQYVLPPLISVLSSF